MKDALLSAKHMIDQASDRNIAVNEHVVRDVATRALAVANHNSEVDDIAWQTAAAAISYIFAQRASFRAPVQGPNCFTTVPQWVLAESITATQTTIPVRPVYSSCTLNLDLTAGGIAQTFDNGFTCKGCFVTYSGGPL
ncbi:MAG: hypothetical protein WBY44_25000, partial [Bryobacteraceae bacterium]